MKASINIPLACALGILVSACGGGGGATPATGSATYSVAGKVPGTLIEAFCSDGSYYAVNSNNDGTTQHPFSLSLPQGVSCRLVMTTNENDPSNKVVTPIRMKKGAAGNIAFTSAGSDVNLGYADLAMGRSAMRSDSNGDGVEDNPLDVDISGAAGDVSPDSSVSDPMDTDRDGIINQYEDDDGDHLPNRDDTDDDNDGIEDTYDNDNGGNGSADNDHDHDGVPNGQDVDDDNDGIRDSSDTDDDNDGIDDRYDNDDDNDGSDDTDDDDNSSGGSSSGSTGGTGVTPPDGARLLASQCFQCHGTEGRSVGGIEGLAEEGGEAASEMLEMKYSSNTNDIMHRQAMGYTDEQIRMIGTYFSSVYGNGGN
ncbi:MAG: hypothetical protein KJ914_11120 [Gammaproteobacteria bacterium]|nr:hypothetical protein [Gammaproteobacteria bacterium]MBU1722397.1 hypothetical protein [Gammaproteobacteria bacterium]MBU2004666.1 hypothetical protein [Gammaproteobacteria bacterium]